MEEDGGVVTLSAAEGSENERRRRRLYPRGAQTRLSPQGMTPSGDKKSLDKIQRAGRMV